MKITKKIAAATLVPAAAAGITVSSLAVASADPPSGHPATSHPASSHPAGQAKSRHLAQVPRHGARHYAKPSAPKKAGKSAGASMNNARPAKARAHHAGHAKAHRRAHAKPAPAAKPTSMFTGMSAFERCVAWRESGNNPTASSAGLFGILPSTWASLGYAGTAGTSSVALQKQAFNRLYAMDGTSPWAPYDGC
jgi:hypothetical protein